MKYLYTSLILLLVNLAVPYIFEFFGGRADGYFALIVTAITIPFSFFYIKYGRLAYNQGIRLGGGLFIGIGMVSLLFCLTWIVLGFLILQDLGG